MPEVAGRKRAVRKAKAEPAPTTPDPIEIAMEAEASGQAPEGVAHRVLAKQEQLIGWQIASAQAGFALRCVAGVAAVAVAVGLGVMAFKASQSSELVVHALSVPPALTEAGVTGAAVATAVLDRTMELERVANDIYVSPVTEGWVERSRIEIPQTGLSVDEVDRLLRAWLGDVINVNGDVRLTPAGVRVTLHARGVSVSAEGPVDQVDQVAGQATDTLHARLRPITHALRDLNQTDPDIEGSLQLLRPVLRANETSRLDWYRATTVEAQAISQQGDLDKATQMFVMVGREAPDARLQVAAYEYAFQIARRRGHPDRAVRYLREMVRYERGSSRENRLGWRAVLAFRQDSDLRLAAQLIAQTRQGVAQQPFATIFARLHEIDRAHLMSGPTGPRTQVYLAAEDWAGLLSRLNDLSGANAAERADFKASSSHPRAREGVSDSPDFNPYWALALAKLGRPSEAKAYADLTPLDCYRCLLSRAEVAEAMGDRSGADRWFAEAIRQNPGTGQAHLDWGRVKLARGDQASALASFRKAAEVWPKWADPLGYWGEVLLAQGDAAGANAKFSEAAKLAPRWGRLHLKWGEALAKLGKADEARAKWRAAATMDLSLAERAALKAHGV